MPKVHRKAAATLVAALSATAVPAHAADLITETTATVKTHRSQGEVRAIDSAAATLVATRQGAFVSVATSGLTPGHAHTMWFVAINDPAACDTRPCTAADVTQRTPLTQADIGFADGLVVGVDGTARFSAHIPVGDLRQAWFGNGFTNPYKAEIHVSIADHGPVLSGLAGSMTSSYRGGCTDASLSQSAPPAARADGTPGPNTCRVVQFAIFDQTGARQAAQR